MVMLAALQGVGCASRADLYRWTSKYNISPSEDISGPPYIVIFY
jgi:hypothetical protein